jgi:flagellar motor switch protein FliM
MAKRDWFSQRAKSIPPKLISLLERGVKRAVVPINAYLAKTTISVKELLDLAPGDVLMTDTRTDEESFLMVNGHMKYKGKPGKFRGKRAFMVTRSTEIDE